MYLSCLILALVCVLIIIYVIRFQYSKKFAYKRDKYTLENEYRAIDVKSKADTKGKMAIAYKLNELATETSKSHSLSDVIKYTQESIMLYEQFNEIYK